MGLYYCNEQKVDGTCEFSDHGGYGKAITVEGESSHTAAAAAYDAANGPIASDSVIRVVNVVSLRLVERVENPSYNASTPTTLP